MIIVLRRHGLLVCENDTCLRSSDSHFLLSMIMREQGYWRRGLYIISWTQCFYITQDPSEMRPTMVFITIALIRASASLSIPRDEGDDPCFLVGYSCPMVGYSACCGPADFVICDPQGNWFFDQCTHGNVCESISSDVTQCAIPGTKL